jgi:hypothetical protein
MISYAGVSLDNPFSDAVLGFIRQRIPESHLYDLCRQTHLHNRLVPLGFAKVLRARPVELQTLFWPWSASRFGLGYFLCSLPQLNLIRSVIYEDDVYQPGQLLIEDGQTDRVIATDMWMLPARPITDIVDPDTGLAIPTPYLLTLVDDRYWWWFRSAQIFINGGSTRWEDLIDELSQALSVSGTSVSIGVDPIPPQYLFPSRAFATNWEELPVVLDALAASIGMRLIRDLGGSVFLQSPTSAFASVGANLTSLPNPAVYAGGELALAGDVDDPGVLPQSVSVIFPQLCCTDESQIGPYLIDVPFTSLTLPFIPSTTLTNPNTEYIHDNLVACCNVTHPASSPSSSEGCLCSFVGSSSSDGTSIDLLVPAGAQPGDILLTFLTAYNDFVTQEPGLWTKLQDSGPFSAPGGSSIGAMLFWKKVSLLEPPIHTWRNGTQISGICVCLRNVGTPDDSAFLFNPTGPPNAPSVNCASTQNFVLCSFHGLDNTPSFGPPGFTESITPSTVGTLGTEASFNSLLFGPGPTGILPGSGGSATLPMVGISVTLTCCPGSDGGGGGGGAGGLAVPSNIAEMTALANQIALDWYSWQVGFLDKVYHGCQNWEVEGFHDLEWAHGGDYGTIWTRIQRSAWNADIRDLCHYGECQDMVGHTGLRPRVIDTNYQNGVINVTNQDEIYWQGDLVKICDKVTKSFMTCCASSSSAGPSGSVPSGSVPSGSVPSGSVPSGSVPSGSLPSGSLPSGSGSPGSGCVCYVRSSSKGSAPYGNAMIPLPPGTLIGDLLMAFLNVVNRAQFVPDPNWKYFSESPPFGAAGSFGTGLCYWKFADATDVFFGSSTWGGGVGEIDGIILDCVNASAPDAAASQLTMGIYPVAPGVNASANENLLFCAFFEANGNARILQPLSMIDSGQDTVGDGIALEVSWQTIGRGFTGQRIGFGGTNAMAGMLVSAPCCIPRASVSSSSSSASVSSSASISSYGSISQPSVCPPIVEIQRSSIDQNTTHGTIFLNLTWPSGAPPAGSFLVAGLVGFQFDPGFRPTLSYPPPWNLAAYQPDGTISRSALLAYITNCPAGLTTTGNFAVVPQPGGATGDVQGGLMIAAYSGGPISTLDTIAVNSGVGHIDTGNTQSALQYKCELCVTWAISAFQLAGCTTSWGLPNPNWQLVDPMVEGRGPGFCYDLVDLRETNGVGMFERCHFDSSPAASFIALMGCWKAQP